MTGLTRQKAAEAVASLFGTMARQTHESRTYDPWEVIDNEGKKWRFVYDSSIHASHRIGRQQLPISDGTYKVEMNSPKKENSTRIFFESTLPLESKTTVSMCAVWGNISTGWIFWAL